MNSLERLIARVGENLRYFQIDTSEILSQLREEISGSAVGTLSGYKQYDTITYGIFEMGVVEFGLFQGHRIGQDEFNHHLAKRHTLYEDRCEWTCDIASKLYAQLVKLTNKTKLDYRFTYQILPNFHVLVGVDEREFYAVSEET